MSESEEKAMGRRRFVADAVKAIAQAAVLGATSEALAEDRGGSRPAAAPPIVYVALGDSTGVGVGARGGGYVDRLFARIDARRPGSRLVNLCQSGATTRDALADQAPRVSRAANLVTIGIGVNDVARSVTEAQFAARFASLVGAIRARTSAPVVVSNLPDVALAPVVPSLLRAHVAQQVEAYNRALAAFAARERLVLFDVHAMSRAFIPQHPEFFSPDGFHPSDAGYEFWAEKFWPTVSAALA